MLFKLLILLIFLVLVLTRTPIAAKLRLGNLPGDFRLRTKRLNIHLPLTSTVLLFAVLYVLLKVL